MANPYGPTLIEHFRNPRNRGTMVRPAVSQEGSNPLCGDRVRIELQIEGGIVTDACFSANACAICVAAADVLADLVRQAPLDEVETLAVDDLIRALKADIPPARFNCIRLPLTVMHAGVQLFRQAAEQDGTR